MGRLGHSHVGTLGIILGLVGGCFEAPSILKKGSATLENAAAVITNTTKVEDSGSAQTLTAVGVVALGETLAVELGDSLKALGLSEQQSAAIADKARREVRSSVIAIEAGGLSLQDLATAKSPLQIATPLIVKGAVKALDDDDVGLPKDARSGALEGVVGSSFKSLNGRMDGLAQSDLESLSGTVVSAAVGSLADGGMAANAAEASRVITKGAVASLGASGIAADNVGNVIAAVVSGTVTGFSQLALADDVVRQIAANASAGAVSSLGKTGMSADASLAVIGQVTASSVAALKSFANAASIIEIAANEVASSAVAALSDAGLTSSDVLAMAVKAVAAGACLGLQDMGLSAEQVAESASAVAAGAIEGLSVAASAEQLAAGGLAEAVMAGTFAAMAEAPAMTDTAKANFMASVVEKSVASLAGSGSDATKSVLLGEVVSSAVGGFQAMGITSVDTMQAALQSMTQKATESLAAAGFTGAALGSAAETLTTATVKGLDQAGIKEMSATELQSLVTVVVGGVSNGLDTLQNAGTIDGSVKQSTMAASSSAATTQIAKLDIAQTLPPSELDTLVKDTQTSLATVTLPAIHYPTGELTLTAGQATTLTPIIDAAAPTSCSVAPPLPKGLALSTTCVLSGTPSEALALSTFTITPATDKGTGASLTLQITVNKPQSTPAAVNPPALSFATLTTQPRINQSVNIAPDQLATNGAPITNCQLTPASPTLPAGLTLSSTTCTISGTPTTTAASAIYYIIATNSAGTSAPAGIAFAIHPNLPSLTYSATTTGVPSFSATVGSAFSIAPTVLDAGGGVITNCSIKPGTPALPPGLNVNATTCVVSGTPTSSSASAAYIIIATNSAGNSADALININVIQTTAPSISYVNAAGRVGNVGNVMTVVPTQLSTGGLTVTCSASTLPAGLSISSDHCVIQGVPTVTVSDTQPFAITISNTMGSATANVFFTINAGTPSLSYTGASGTIMAPGVYGAIYPTIFADNGSQLSACTAAPDLPNGLVLDANDCSISGTPDSPQAATQYSITATNTVGSATAMINISVVVAPGPPQVTGGSIVDGIPLPTNNVTPTWTWSTSEPNATGNFRYRLGNGDMSSGTTTTSSTSFTPSSPLSDGVHTLFVQAEHAGGTWSQVASAAWTVDTLAPTPTINLSPLNAGVSNADFLSLDAYTSGATEFKFKYGATGVVACGDTSGYSVWYSVGSSQPVDVTNMVDGGYTVCVLVRDASGNTSPPSSLSWTRDTAPPSAPVVTAPASPVYSMTTNLQIDVSCENGTAVYRDNIYVGVCAGGTSTIFVSNDPSVRRQVAIFQVDTAGNTSQPAIVTWIRDDVAPGTVQIEEPRDGYLLSGDSSIQISGNCETSATVTLGGAGSASTTCTNGQFTLSDTKGSDGNYTYNIAQTDAAGNSFAPKQVVWQRSSATHSATPTLTSNGGLTYIETTGETLTLAGSCITSGTVALMGDVLSTDVVGNSLSQTCSAGTYSFTINKSAGPLGYKLGVAQQVSGNWSAHVGVWWEAAATLPPPPVIDSPLSPFTSSDFLYVMGTCSPGNEVKEQTSNTSTACDETGNFAMTVNSGAFGTLGLNFVEISQGGLTSSPTPFTWERDSSVVPTPGLTMPSSRFVESTDTSLVITGTCAPGTDINIDVDYTQIAVPLETPVTPCVGGHYLFVLDFSSEPSPPPIAIFASDPSNNMSAEVLVYYMRDNTAPDVSLDAVPSSPNLSLGAWFTASSTDSLVSFECALDGAPYFACDPYPEVKAANGAHTFYIRTRDFAGNLSAPASHTWTQSAHKSVALYHFDGGSPLVDSGLYGLGTLNDGGSSVPLSGLFSSNARQLGTGITLVSSAADAFATLANQLTIEGFIKINTAIASGTAYGIALLDDGADLAFGLSIANNGSIHTLTFTGTDDGITPESVQSSSFGSPGTTTFHHFAVTFDQGEVQFYWDGTPQGGGNLGMIQSLFMPAGPILSFGTDADINDNDISLEEVRISQTLRYRGPFAVPNAAFTPD